MSLSIQRSAIETFSFNGKDVRSVHVKEAGECLVSADVYKIIGYNKENGKKQIQRLVPEKYKLHVGDVLSDFEKKGDKIVPLHPDTVLLKEPGLYCFLLRCGKKEAEPFMEWVVETVLPREVRKLNAAIERQQRALEAKDAAIESLTQKVAAIELTSQTEQAAHTAELEELEEEVDDLIQNRHVPRRGLYDNVLCFVDKNQPDEEGIGALYPFWVIRCQMKVLENQKRALRRRYPDMVVMEPVCDDGNAIHCWNRFKREWLGKGNYMGNQFFLPDSARDEFARLFGIVT